MRLTDIMSHMELHVFPEIGLGIFLVVFACIVTRVMTTRKSESHKMSMLPLQDERGAKEMQDGR